MNAPAAPEAEDNHVNKRTDNAGEKVDEDVANGCVAADNRKLVHFVDGAVNYAKNDWVKNQVEIWKFGSMKTFNEAADGVAKSAKEDKMGKFTREGVSHADG